MDSNTAIVVLCGLGMIVGVFGVIVPVLPGVLLCWLSVLAWALFSDAGQGRWIVLGIATLIAMFGWLVKYLLPGKRLKDSGVPKRSIIVGGLLALLGFFFIPVVGLIVGFVGGIYLAEHARKRNAKQAWASTKHALKAVGLAMLIELGTALGIAATWVVGLMAA